MTPVTLRILQASLIPVRATDGFIHLADAHARDKNLSPYPNSPFPPHDSASGLGKATGAERGPRAHGLIVSEGAPGGG
jgi:hypothetical protein